MALIVDNPEEYISGRTMPRQKPHCSKQDYGTPRVLLDAVERRYGKLVLDLAARGDNAVCDAFITPERDSLKVDWEREYHMLVPNRVETLPFAWLNPPFSNIAAWAEKCAEASFPILMLVPASIGSNWFGEWVLPHAKVIGLAPRITFVGAKDPYPKDCMLCEYGGQGFEQWNYLTDEIIKP